LTDKHTDSYFEDTVLEQKSISAEEVRSFRRLFEFLAPYFTSRCYELPGFRGVRLLKKTVDRWDSASYQSAYTGGHGKRHPG